jgi:hypothetical protein
MKKIILAYMLFICVMSVSAQLSRHGLVLNGGIGCVDSKTDKSSVQWQEVDYKSGFSVGYRLRLKKPATQFFHYDIDVNVGAKVLKSTSYTRYPDEGYYSNVGYGGYSSSPTPKLFTSVVGAANYSIIKNLSAGLGVEPTYYFRGDNNFDIPIVAKIAYSLKVVEFEISGKYGLMNVKSGKMREIQLSLFIPF